ncbi:MAG: DGQHR domain-containing protein [Candidatus Uhrbacteria bacterium]|nr:DGQHR domain-containing protein [Candidatus Uhrbacteria bacterium]
MQEIIEFGGVQTAQSGAITFFIFHVRGDVLARIAVVRRLEEDGDAGVQRGAKEQHVQAIIKAMRGDVPFPENMVANLGGDWIHEGGILLANDGQTAAGRLATVEIIDGQHRLIALRRLIEKGEETTAASYTFTVHATLNATNDLRAQLFSMQRRRMGVDRTHDLMLRARHNDFTNDTEKGAFALATALNVRGDSPLKGKIFFGERSGTNNRNRIPRGMFALRALTAALRPIVSDRNGPMKAFSMKDREQIVVDLFRSAAETFTNFLKPEHTLGQSLGINALLAILSKTGEFHLRLLQTANGDRREAYRQGAMTVVLRQGQRFQWKPRSDIKFRAFASPYAIAERFNEFLQRDQED